MNRLLLGASIALFTSSPVLADSMKYFCEGSESIIAAEVTLNAEDLRMKVVFADGLEVEGFVGRAVNPADATTRYDLLANDQFHSLVVAADGSATFSSWYNDTEVHSCQL